MATDFVFLGLPVLQSYPKSGSTLAVPQPTHSFFRCPIMNILKVSISVTHWAKLSRAKYWSNLLFVLCISLDILYPRYSQTFRHDLYIYSRARYVRTKLYLQVRPSMGTTDIKPKLHTSDISNTENFKRERGYYNGKIKRNVTYQYIARPFQTYRLYSEPAGLPKLLESLISTFVLPLGFLHSWSFDRKSVSTWFVF